MLKHIKNVYESFGVEALTLTNITVMQKWERSKNIVSDKFIRTKTFFIKRVAFVFTKNGPCQECRLVMEYL